MKLRRKLLSAGFALGATALTLTTSTFAWYTSNTEVTAKQVTGKTSAEADTDSIYIAAAASYNSTNYAVATMGGYGKEATPVYVAKSLDSTATITLAPVSYVDASNAPAKYVPLDKAEASTTTSTVLDKPVYKSYDPNNVVEFVLRFRTANSSTTATKLYFSKFDLLNTNTASTVDAKTVYGYEQIALTNNADTGLETTGVASAGSYGVDFRKALKMTVVATEMTNATTLGSTTKTTVYDFEEIGYTGDKALHTDNNIDSSKKANALGYLNAVMGYDLSTPTDYLKTSGDFTLKKLKVGSSLTAESAYSPFEIPTSGYLEVRFTIWLDGWDEYCYDVCRKQGFSLDMAFTTSAEKAVIQ